MTKEGSNLALMIVFLLFAWSSWRNRTMSNVQDKKLEDQITKLTSDLDAAKQRIAELKRSYNDSQAELESRVRKHVESQRIHTNQLRIEREAKEAAERKLATIQQAYEAYKNALRNRENGTIAGIHFQQTVIEALAQIEREPARALETKHAYAIQQYGADVVVDHVFQGHEKMPPECRICGLHFLRHARVP